MEKCKNDFFFWLETFAFLYEPRPEGDRPKVLPFIPWDHQRKPAQTIIDNLGYEDIGLEKARGEGASWLCLMIILWRWLFHDMESFGLVSMSEMAADNPDDANSLGWKLDFQLRMLPRWMTGDRAVSGKPGDWTRNISKHTWINNRTQSSITAYACTGDLASGGRKTAFLMDELAKFPRGPDEDAMAATEPVTNCRILVSTPKGADGAYYRCMNEPSSMVKIVLDWTRNPTRNKNLFRIDMEGKRLLRATQGVEVEIKGDWVEKFWNTDVPILQRRGFDVYSKNKVWSPWYVRRCTRPRMTPKKVAQEYDRDYGGSASRFFPASSIEMLCEKARDPVVRGEVLWSLDSLEVETFTKMRNGRLKLWIELEGGVRPPRGDYVMGGDIATGQGGTMSSNSVLSIVDIKSGKKVAEFATPNMKPEQFAELAIALAKWFANSNGGPAYMAWEGNGPGGSFRNRILESSFRNFYYRTSSKSVRSKATKEPGWWANKDGKRELMSKYRHSLVEGYFDNPNELALRETLCYIEGTSGKLVYESGQSDDEDPANDGENHGDRVVADALANLAMEQLNGGSNTHKESSAGKKNLSSAKPGSFGYRRKKWLEKNSKRQMGWSKQG